MSLRPGWVGLVDAVAEARRWTRTPQRAKNATCSHLGYSTHVGDGLFVSIAPNGRRGSRARGAERERHEGDAVMVFQLHLTVESSGVNDDGSTWYLPTDQFDEYRNPPFTDDEWRSLVEVVEAAGFDVVETWNGPGLDTGSMRLAPGTCVPTVSRLVSNYLRYCPDHGGPFCGCDVWRAQFAAANPPQWVEVPRAMPAAPDPSIGNRNLDVVLAAIAAARPFLDDLAIHPSTVVPGRRGRVEGGDYVDEEGLAVAVPAELFTTLVEMARHTFES